MALTKLLGKTGSHQRGALTTRGTDDLVSRGLADLQRLEEAKAASIAPEECYERGKRLFFDTARAAPAGRYRKYAEVVTWYRRAAKQGHVEAQFNLGFMYATGRGVTQDETVAVRVAVRWYRLAADQGYAGAQSNLGVMYEKGRGVPQDETEAVRWYRLAADQGLAEAQHNLGRMYEKGRGVPQDDTEAVRWYRFAADQGVADALSNLRVMYEKGRRPAG